MKTTTQRGRGVKRNEDGVERHKRDGLGRELIEGKAFLTRSRRAFDVEELDVEVRQSDVGERSARFAREREVVRDRRVERDPAQFNARRKEGERVVFEFKSDLRDPIRFKRVAKRVERGFFLEKRGAEGRAERQIERFVRLKREREPAKGRDASADASELRFFERRRGDGEDRGLRETADERVKFLRVVDDRRAPFFAGNRRRKGKRRERREIGLNERDVFAEGRGVDGVGTFGIASRAVEAPPQSRQKRLRSVEGRRFRRRLLG